MTDAKFTDVTGITINIVAAEHAEIILNLSEEQRQYVKVFADTIKNPHEIFKLLRRDPLNSNHWMLIRAYLQVLNFSTIENEQSFAISVVEFVWEKRWKIKCKAILLGELDAITKEANKTIRFGERIYLKNHQAI